MNSLIVLFCVATAAQAALLPAFYGAHVAQVVPTVAKSTITYKTAAYEPVDAATPADTKKIELVETEHTKDVYTPTYTTTYGAALHHPIAAPFGVYGAAVHPGFYGFPYSGLPVVAAAAAAAPEAEAAAVEEA